jgi:hypothetical protein
MKMYRGIKVERQAFSEEKGRTSFTMYYGGKVNSLYLIKHKDMQMY